MTDACYRDSLAGRRVGSQDYRSNPRSTFQEHAPVSRDDRAVARHIPYYPSHADIRTIAGRCGMSQSSVRCCLQSVFFCAAFLVCEDHGEYCRLKGDLSNI